MNTVTNREFEKAIYFRMTLKCYPVEVTEELKYDYKMSELLIEEYNKKILKEKTFALNTMRKLNKTFQKEFFWNRKNNVYIFFTNEQNNF